MKMCQKKLTKTLIQFIDYQVIKDYNDPLGFFNINIH